MTNIIKTGYNLHNILYMIETIHALKLLNFINYTYDIIYNNLDMFALVLNIN